MIWKIAGWGLILTGLFGLIKLIMQLTSINDLPTISAVVILALSVLPIILGVFTLREKKWAAWFALFYFLIQIVGIHTPEFLFNISGPVDLSITLSLTDGETGKASATFILNIFAIIMSMLLADVVRKKTVAQSS